MSNKMQLQLTASSGEKIPLGMLKCQCSTGNKETWPLIIIKGDRPALMGHNWQEEIQLNIFSLERAVTDTDWQSTLYYNAIRLCFRKGHISSKISKQRSEHVLTLIPFFRRQDQCHTH
jgi:hypothetical protein